MRSSRRAVASTDTAAIARVVHRAPEAVVKVIYGDVNQITLDEQIERARRAALRIDAGYYFTDDELDEEKLASA